MAHNKKRCRKSYALRRKVKTPKVSNSLQNALKLVDNFLVILNVLAMIPMFSEQIEANVYLQFAYQFLGTLKWGIEAIIKVWSLQNALKSVDYVFLLLNAIPMIPMFSELIEANVYLHIAYQFRGILKWCIKEIIIKWW